MSSNLRSVALGILVLCLTLSPSRPASGQNPPAQGCPARQISAFRFLVGQWSGEVYNLNGSDSTAGPTARVVAEPILGGCALLERWHFEEGGVTEVDAVVLRAFDAPTGKWSYDIATSAVEHVTYEGEQAGDTWSFHRDIVVDGKGVRVRLTWVPRPSGYSEQIARSMDGGHTWTQTRHINFRAAPPQ